MLSHPNSLPALLKISRASSCLPPPAHNPQISDILYRREGGRGCGRDFSAPSPTSSSYAEEEEEGGGVLSVFFSEKGGFGEKGKGRGGGGGEKVINPQRDFAEPTLRGSLLLRTPPYSLSIRPFARDSWTSLPSCLYGAVQVVPLPLSSSKRRTFYARFFFFGVVVNHREREGKRERGCGGERRFCKRNFP